MRDILGMNRVVLFKNTDAQASHSQKVWCSMRWAPEHIYLFLRFEEIEGSARLGTSEVNHPPLQEVTA